MLTLSVATNRTFKNTDGTEKEETHWHRATVWGKRAETCAKYLTKGSRVYLEGELRSSSWKDREGIERKSVEIWVESIFFLGGTLSPEKQNQSEEELLPAMAH